MKEAGLVKRKAIHTRDGRPLKFRQLRALAYEDALRWELGDNSGSEPFHDSVGIEDTAMPYLKDPDHKLCDRME